MIRHSSRRTTIGEASGLTVLLDELLIVQLLVRSITHNGLTGSGEAYYLIINSLALPQLTLKSLGVLLAELIVAVEATLVVFEDYTASTGNIAIVIYGTNILHRPLQNLRTKPTDIIFLLGKNLEYEVTELVREIISLQYRQVASSL
jgi:hypothetical protein